MSGRYRGFSSFDFKPNTIFQTWDVDLVKRDLLNAIFSKKGTIVKNRLFGTRIHEYLFKPFDDITFSMIERELVDVINLDPRVELLSMSRDPNIQKKSVTFTFTLRYIELNIDDEFLLVLNFEA